jgi:hypothetical protein
MDTVTTSKGRQIALRTLADAIGKAALDYPDFITANMVNEQTTLTSHWMFRACRKASQEWDKNLATLKDGVTLGWAQGDTVGSFLNNFEFAD